VRSTSMQHEVFHSSVVTIALKCTVSSYGHETDRQTDRQTDGRTDGRIVASRNASWSLWYGGGITTASVSRVRRVATFSALGGRAMRWGATDSK